MLCQNRRPVTKHTWIVNMRMHRLQLFIAFLMLFSATTVLAQRLPNVEARLAELDRHLEFARAIVTSFNDPRALELLEKALVERDKARVAIGARRLQQAITHLKLARSFAEQAIKLTLEGPVARFRTRLEELIRRAESMVIGSGHRQAERFLQKAKENQRRAFDFLRARNIGRAIEHYRFSEKLARQAIELIERRGRTPRSAVELARDQYDRLRQRTHEAVVKSGNANAERLYQQALKRGRSAQQSFVRGRLGLAAEHFNQAIRLFNRALEVAGAFRGQIDVRLDGELKTLDELISSARHRSEDRGEVRGRILLDRAEQLRREAEQAAHAGDSRRARWKINVARSLVARALKIIEGSPEKPGDRLREELRRLRDDIRELRREAESQGYGEALELVDLAEKAAVRAENFLRQERPRLSLEAVLVGNRFLLAAERLLRRGEIEEASEEALRRRLGQLNEAIAEIERRLVSSDDPWQQTLLEQAKEARERAERALANNQRVVARINISIGFEAIRKIVRTFEGD
jgi:hypothetical protein